MKTLAPALQWQHFLLLLYYCMLLWTATTTTSSSCVAMAFSSSAGLFSREVLQGVGRRRPCYPLPTVCLSSSARDFLRRQTALFTSISNDHEDSSVVPSTTAAADQSKVDRSTSLSSLRRRTVLDDKLNVLGIDATSLHRAVQSTLSNPTEGYDGTFGRSAIKTYRSFLYPKQLDVVMDDAQLIAMAGRTAQQIDFLLKRHASHQQEWVRHHDASDPQGQAPDEERRTTVFPMMILLDNLRSAFNVGSIFRTADATGCEAVLTTGITPHPGGSGSEKVAKAALGAQGVVPSRHFDTTAAAIEWLRETHPNYQILGLETTARSRSYTDKTYPRDGVVICLGNEVTGLDTNVMPLLDDLLEIPMFGTKNSLNVASCAPIVLYEIVRQWDNNK